MSRIGKKSIEVPAGVKVAVGDGSVRIEGPKGKLSMKLRPEVKVSWAESEKAIKVTLDEKYASNPDASAYWGTTRALIRNMVEGVTKSYEKSMQVVGTGWSAAVNGKQLKMVLGYASPVLVPIPDGLTVVVEKTAGDTTPIKISGNDRQLVGQFASILRSKRKPEPYNGKGVKYTEEVIKRKQGKQFGA